MPIYEYECSSCHHHFDLMQKISDEPIKECPECHQNTVTKLISAAGFQLKGTGWYATDFKNKNNSAPADSSAKKEDSTKKTETNSSTGSTQGD